VPVYKAKSVTSTKQLLLRIVRALPIKWTPELEKAYAKLGQLREPIEDGGLSADIGDWHVSVSNHGQFTAWKLDEVGYTESVLCPTEKEARDAADKIVMHLKPLLPVSIHFVSAFEAETINGRACVRGVSYEADKLNDIPIAGQLHIRVGPGGKVDGVMSSLRNIEVADNAVPILSPAEAVQMCLAGKAHRGGGPSWNAIAYIDTVELVYWEAVVAIDYPYIMPVYILKGEAVAEGKKPARWSARIEAIRPEYLRAETDRTEDMDSLQ
jgi:hypothetical protein